jgi:hypothetical protein
MVARRLGRRLRSVALDSGLACHALFFVAVRQNDGHDIAP